MYLKDYIVLCIWNHYQAGKWSGTASEFLSGGIPSIFVQAADILSKVSCFP
jgi:hypothetical protein